MRQSEKLQHQNMKEGRREVRKTRVEWCIYRESDQVGEGREREGVCCAYE